MSEREASDRPRFERKFSERKSSEHKSSERSSSGRAFSDRGPSEGRAGGQRRPERKFSERHPYSETRSDDDAALRRKPTERASRQREDGDRRPFDRKPDDRKFSDRKFAERRSSDRKFSDRPSRDRDHARGDDRPEHDRPKRRTFADRGDADRRGNDRRPNDRKTSDRKTSDRKSFGHKTSDRKTTDRTTADRKFSDRKSFDRKPERRPSERHVEKSRPFENSRPSDEQQLPEQLSAAVQTVEVTPDENGMRVDRFLEARFSGLSFSHIQRIIRKGQLRVDGKRVEPKDRLESGQSVRIPPLRLDPEKPRPEGGKDDETREFLKSITLYEDDDVMVLNKPAGLAVQGGSGTTRHVDGMLGVIRTKDGQRPRLVHRLDKDTAGCLLIAKSRFAAAALAKTFRSRSARKIYWALVPGVPKPKQGRISTYLAKEEREDDSVMRVAQHGEEGASHAITYYAVVETAAARLAWLSLKPVTGRTHQLRVQLAHIKHPIVGDPKYFNIENWELPGGIQNRLHLLARRLAVPHPRGGVIDATAPLPPHMQQTWNLIGLDASRYDPIEDAPEE